MLGSGGYFRKHELLRIAVEESELGIYPDINERFHVFVIVLNNCLIVSSLLWSCGSLLRGLF